MKRLATASLLALLGSSGTLRAQRDNPHVVERRARRAVEHGLADSERARWTTRLRSNPGDRAAQLGLACLLDLTYAYAAAASRYRVLSDTAGATPDAYSAFALMAWGRMDELRGAVNEADRAYVAARVLARRVGDRTTEAMVAASQSFPRANTVSLGAGLATLDTAFRLLPADAGDDVRSDFARRRATLLAVQLDPRTRATTDEAIRLARRAGDRRAEANAMRALALHHRMRSFSDSARAALDTTARLQRASRDRRALSETLARIANEYLGERRLGDARATLVEARVEAIASHNDFAFASAETGLGALSLRVHDLPTAIEHLRRAESLNVAAHDTASLVVVRNYQVVALLDAGLPDSAWSLQRTVLAQFERSNEIPELVVNHRVLANIALAQRRFDLATRELDTAEALVRRARIPAASPPLWFDRARLLLRTGRETDAIPLLTRYIASLRQDDGVARWEAELYLAEIDARLGSAPSAARRLAAASDALERWRAAQSDSTLRLLAFQASAHEESDRDATFAATIAALAARGQADAAFEQVERRRARTLAERIVQTNALRVGPLGAQSIERVEYRATARSIAAALPDDRTALLEYVTGAGGAPTTLFVVTRSGVRVARLSSVDSLLPAIRRFVAAIEAADDARQGARALGDALLAPALLLLDARIERLVIVPDGALHRVPFDALRLDGGRAVIERYETSIVPSSAIAALLWRRPATSHAGGARVLAFGDPSFAMDRGGRTESTTALGRENVGTGNTFVRLPASGREARIAASYGTRSVARLRHDASAAYLRHAPVDSFAVLHLATHAVVDDRSLTRSTVVLAAADGDGGLLSPGDLGTLATGVELVILSACRSAGGVVVNGEGVQGLTGPLLAAGVRAVVATAWPVDDGETVSLIEDFYRALASGERVGAALRSAKLSALRRGAPARDWASFSVIGDPFVLVPLSAPRRIPWTAVLATSALAATTVVAVRRRRRFA